MNMEKVQTTKTCSEHICNDCGEKLYTQTIGKSLIFAAIIFSPMAFVMGLSSYLDYRKSKLPEPPFCYKEHWLPGDNGLSNITQRQIVKCPKEE
jgi:hypothetical protein